MDGISSQTQEEEEEINKLDDSTSKNIYDPSQWTNIDTNLRNLLVLIYYKDLDKVFYFCCKLFNTIPSISKLTNEGNLD
uniref:Uncharacterized protein n=1 Tax=Cajanus cajan TaxID=3821 RepID=A0A151UGN0_CAJCA